MKLFRSVIVMASGTAGAQLITLAFMPILTRLYGPEAFGVYGTFMAFFLILAPLSVLSYSIAIVLPEKDEEAKGLMVLSFIVGFMVCCLCLLVLILWGDNLLKLLNLELNSLALFFIPFALLFHGTHQVLHHWLLRSGEYKKLGFFSGFNSFIINSSKLGLYYVSPTGLVLIFAGFLQYLTHALMLLRFVFLSSRAVISPLSCKYFIGLAIRYRDYPFFRTPQLLINSLSNSIPVIILASLFGQEEVGHFTLAWSITSAPALLIGQAIGSVFYPEITKRINAGNRVNHLLLKFFSILAAMSFIPFFVIFIFGDLIFSIIFGTNWMMAGQYASYIALAVFLGLVHRPCEAYLQAANRNKSYVLFEISSLILCIILMWVAYKVFMSSIAVVQAFVIAKVIYYVVIIIYSYRNSRSNSLSVRA